MPVIAPDAQPVVLIDHSMEFQAPIENIAKLCRRIIGVSGILESQGIELHNQEAVVVSSRMGM